MAKIFRGFGVWRSRQAVDHECAGWMGFEEVVDVGDDGDDGGWWCKEGAAGEAFDE